MSPKKGATVAKVLHVEMDENRNLLFSFGGKWAGPDVRIIRSLLPREYRKHQRSVRRDVEAVEPPKQEVSDDGTK